MTIPPVPPMPKQPDSIFTYNDLLKQYAGLAMQSILAGQLHRLSPNSTRQLADEAFEIADAMALAYDQYRKD